MSAIMAGLVAVMLTNIVGIIVTMATGFGTSWTDKAFAQFVIGLDSAVFIFVFTATVLS